MASSSCTCWRLYSSSFRMQMMRACCSRWVICLRHTLLELYNLNLVQECFWAPIEIITRPEHGRKVLLGCCSRVPIERPFLSRLVFV